MTIGQPAMLRLFVVAFAAVFTCAVSAQDVIRVRDSNSPDIHEFRGQVVGWNDERLVWTAGDRNREIPANRVLDVEYAKSPAHLEADLFLAEGRIDQAARAYENAVAGEARSWVVEELLARRLQCAVATGDVMRAADRFTELVTINPQTRFFHLIPLAWQNSERIDGGLAGLFRGWLDGNDPVRGLIAASWLLATDEPTALAKLKQLAVSSDRRIAWMADAQVWRTRWIVADAAELGRWQAAIERMPEPWQAGPRLLAATLQKRLQPDESAAIALLQLPILFADRYRISGAALGEAHELLESLGRQDDAAIAARELTTVYPFSPAAAALGQTELRMDNQEPGQVD
jgi:hypothetical protein